MAKTDPQNVEVLANEAPANEMRVSRDEMIAKVINAKYSIDDQIAIIRQRDNKPEEYAEFYAFAEQVKADVTAEYAAFDGEQDE